GAVRPAAGVGQLLLSPRLGPDAEEGTVGDAGDDERAFTPFGHGAGGTPHRPLAEPDPVDHHLGAHDRILVAGRERGRPAGRPRSVLRTVSWLAGSDGRAC